MFEGILGKLKVGVMIGLAVFVCAAILLISYGLGKNDDQNWQLKQSVTGTVTMIDNPGWYVKAFATVWTWPRSIDRYFSQKSDEGGAKDESIRATFNDGGTAQISTMIRIQTPTDPELRRKAHRDFGGDPEEMLQSVKAHLNDCLKSTAPLMSSSEHQSARKAEFAQIVSEQLAQGQYKMNKIEKELKDRTDQNGKPITVYATEIVRDENGQPMISKPSPLAEYGIKILQFSVTATEYDKMTRQQFEAKKASFLAAEKSKAEREQEVQQRLMIEERGLREKAEVEAVANKEMAAATISAEKDKRVAELVAQKAVTIAVQGRLEQEELKQKALIEASREKEVADIALETARAQAEAKIVLAKADEQKILLAGMITEKDRVTLEIAAKRDAMVAAEISKIKVPQVMIAGGSAGGGGDDIMKNMINLKLLEGAGLLDPMKPIATK